MAVTADIHFSISRGDLKGVKAALQNGEELNAKSESNHNQTPIMHAVLNGQDAIVEYLLTLKPDLSITDAAKPDDPQGYAPLHGAAFKGRANIARMLIDAGENPEKLHEDGFSAFHRATWGSSPGHAATVKVFLDSGVDPALIAGDGTNALNMASEAKNDATVKVLKEALTVTGRSDDIIARMANVQSPKPGEVDPMMAKMMQDPDFMGIMQKLAGKFGSNTDKFKEVMKSKLAASGGDVDKMKNVLKDLADSTHTEL